MFKRILVALCMAMLVSGLFATGVVYAKELSTAEKMKIFEEEKQDIVFDQKPVNYYLLSRDSNRALKVALPGNVSYISILADMKINRRYTVVSENLSGIDLFTDKVKKFSDPNSNYYNIMPGVYFIACSIELAELLDGDPYIRRLVSEFKSKNFPNTPLFGVVVYKLDRANYENYIRKMVLIKKQMSGQRIIE